MSNGFIGRNLVYFFIALAIYVAIVILDLGLTGLSWYENPSEIFNEVQVATDSTPETAEAYTEDTTGSTENTTEDANKEKSAIEGVLPNILGLIIAFIKGVIDSHIIIVMMFFYFIRYMEESKLYRRKARDRKDDLDHFMEIKLPNNLDENSFLEEKNIFNSKVYSNKIQVLTERGKKGEASLNRYRELYENLNEKLDSSISEARELVASNEEGIVKDKKNGLQTFDFFQNKIALFGFLGTVLGLIIAVGRTKSLFSGGGDLNEVMPSVVEGLSIAFVTTAFSLICTIIIVAAKRKFENTHDSYIKAYHSYATAKIKYAPTPKYQNVQNQLRKVSSSFSTVTNNIESLGKELGGIFQATISKHLSNTKESLSKLNSEIDDLE